MTVALQHGALCCLRADPDVSVTAGAQGWSVGRAEQYAHAEHGERVEQAEQPDHAVQAEPGEQAWPVVPQPGLRP